MNDIKAVDTNNLEIAAQTLVKLCQIESDTYFLTHATFEGFRMDRTGGKVVFKVFPPEDDVVKVECDVFDGTKLPQQFLWVCTHVIWVSCELVRVGKHLP